MSTLTEATPSYFDANEVRFGDPDRIGGYIAVVYPPDRTRNWRIVKYRVTEDVYPPFTGGKDDKRVQVKTRMYQTRDAELPAGAPATELGWRLLTAEEIAHFAALMATWVKPQYEPIAFDKSK